MVRRSAFLGVPWKETGGYARAVRVGNIVDVGMTTAASPDGTILYPGDVYMQTKEAIRIIGDALVEVGASFEDVFRTPYVSGRYVALGGSGTRPRRNFQGHSPDDRLGWDG